MRRFPNPDKHPELGPKPVDAKAVALALRRLGDAVARSRNFKNSLPLPQSQTIGLYGGAHLRIVAGMSKLEGADHPGDLFDWNEGEASLAAEQEPTAQVSNEPRTSYQTHQIANHAGRITVAGIGERSMTIGELGGF